MVVRKFSWMVFVVGLTVGLVGAWASAAPVLGSGHDVLGGWYLHVNHGCTSTVCNACRGTTWSYCASGQYNNGSSLGCTGGSIIIALATSVGGTPADSTVAGCQAQPGSWWGCPYIRHAACN